MTSMPNESYDGGNRITVDIVDRALTIVGPGPLLTCMALECDTLLSQAGHFTARFPANDPMLARLQLKRHFLDFFIDGERVFFGLTESWNYEIDDSGQQILVVSGRDSLAELAETSLNFFQYLDLSEPNANAPFHIVNAYNDTNGYADDTVPAWTLASETTAPAAYPITETLVYGSFAGEAAMVGLTRIAEHTGEAFRLALTNPVRTVFFDPPDPRRHVEWLGTRQTASGVRAVQGAGDPIEAEGNPQICFIQQLSERRDASRMFTKIHPYGAGLGETRLDLAGTSKTAPTGFVLDEADNSISSTAAAAYIGKTISRHVNFKDIRPLYNTDADVEYAKDYLFDAALAYLQRNDDIDDNVEYDMDVMQLPRHVKVGMTLRVVYQDDRYDLDTDLTILGIRFSVSSNGVVTYSLTVARTNQWRLSETSAIVAQMEEGEILLAHPQIDGNSYWENFRELIGDDQTDHVAEMPFVLAEEIVTIRQVIFRYKVERILALVKTYMYEEGSTDENATSNTGDTSVTIDNTTVTVANTVATMQNTTVAVANTVATAQNATVTVNNTVATMQNTTVDVTPAAAGDTVSGGDGVTSTLTSIGANIETNYNATGTMFTVPVDVAQLDTSTQIPSGIDHYHTHAHVHSGTELPQHWHAVTHDHTTPAHVHSITATHDHATTAHAHTMDTHGHTAVAHTHTMDTHGHTTTAHAHTMDTHGHTTTAHTHTNAAHFHVSPQHVHTMPNLEETVGLERVPALNSYVLADLEYSVNGGTWEPLSDGTPVAGGFYQLDITPLVQNPDGKRRPYQEDNLIQVRRTTAAGTGKTAQIRVKLGIRSTIQSIAIFS